MMFMMGMNDFFIDDSGKIFYFSDFQAKEKFVLAKFSASLLGLNVFIKFSEIIWKILEDKFCESVFKLKFFLDVFAFIEVCKSGWEKMIE